MPAMAADDPLAVVNNLSDFIFSLIRTIGLILLGFGVLQLGLSLKSHAPSQQANGMMVYIVKTALYVALNKPLCPREIFLHILECRMAAFVHAETVGVVAEGWLIDTLQNEPRHLLYQFVIE